MLELPKAAISTLEHSDDANPHAVLADPWGDVGSLDLSGRGRTNPWRVRRATRSLPLPVPVVVAVNKRYPPPIEPSAYLLLKPRTLREVCRTSHRDDNARRCPECDLRDLCEGQAEHAASEKTTGIATGYAV